MVSGIHWPSCSGQVVRPDIVLVGDAVASDQCEPGLVETPTDYEALIRQDIELAKVWRGHIRDILERLLAAGYMVTDFVREPYENRDRAFYLLSLGDKVFERVDFSRN